MEHAPGLRSLSCTLVPMGATAELSLSSFGDGTLENHPVPLRSEIGDGRALIPRLLTQRLTP